MAYHCHDLTRVGCSIGTARDFYVLWHVMRCTCAPHVTSETGLCVPDSTALAMFTHRDESKQGHLKQQMLDAAICDVVEQSERIPM